MGRPAPMHLSEDERIHVQVFVRRGKANARALTRARVLLKSDSLSFPKNQTGLTH